MVIRFTRARHSDRPPTMTVVRDDGTVTGQATTPFFVAHDLTHYAAETVLGFRAAFYGLLAIGWNIDSFSERQPGSAKMRTMPPQAGATEILVGCLDAQRADPAYTDDMILARLAEQWPSLGVDASLVDDTALTSTLEKRDNLMGRYAALAPGGSLELEF